MDIDFENIKIIPADKWVAKILIEDGDTGEELVAYEQLLFFIVTPVLDMDGKPLISHVDAMLSCGTMAISNMGNEFQGYYLRSTLPENADILTP